MYSTELTQINMKKCKSLYTFSARKFMTKFQTVLSANMTRKKTSVLNSRLRHIINTFYQCKTQVYQSPVCPSKGKHKFHIIHHKAQQSWLRSVQKLQGFTLFFVKIQGYSRLKTLVTEYIQVFWRPSLGLGFESRF